MIDRRAILAATLGFGAAPARAAQSQAGLALFGRPQQGGCLIGRTRPAATVFVDGEALATASADGWFLVGLDRDSASSIELVVRDGDFVARRTLDVAPGDFPLRRIDGLPPSTLEPEDPLLLARIAREVALKTEGFASRTRDDAFRDGFDMPLASWRVSSEWGAQRILNGTPARPHYGIDLAAPMGTPIRAPADGLVSLAEPDLHFEGGLTLIDHGQGAITAYLHQSRLDVTAGQRVTRGQIIGAVGMSGRATGPHLCWRMRWRDRQMNPALLVGRPPAL